ncbi:LuxR C-terminal-related transcriptional regulator [Amycolatopsis sp. YIM 10]|uniref:response regulator transcription factor n=1 Tax=Amycolatopsis sp. YIM 10 TaxID=2653857 RepID=UPI00129038A9|nr:response regulator transcription factor [Amycolatopsis sp. YIM 10]QFU89399.1 Transcriptional regulatory protein LiaR [Amycolatopsis sp. YIM 10]
MDLPGHKRASPPVRVFLIDDEEMLAEALAARLSAEPGLLVVGRSRVSAPGLADVVACARPSVLVIDIEPAWHATATLFGCLTSATPGARIVVLTDSHDPVRTTLAARWGVTAWIGKENCSAEYIVTVVRGVCEGKAYFEPELIGFVLAQLRTELDRARAPGSPLGCLSGRENDVLLGIVEGKPASRIAKELFVSINTVRTHTHNLFAKLNVHSRLEAAAIGRAAGLRPRRAAVSAYEAEGRLVARLRNGSGNHDGV